MSTGKEFINRVRRIFYVTIMVLVIAISLTACGKTEEIMQEENKVVTDNEEEVEPEGAEEPDEVLIETEEIEDEMVQIYKSFFNDDVKVHLNVDEYVYQRGSLLEGLEGGDYTFTELLDIFREKCAESEDKSTDGRVSVEYAYIDCGMDGGKELALKITDEVAADSWTEYLIIKDFDGVLETVYSDIGWSRCSIFINEFGYVYASGSNGAASHGFDEGYIDENGKYHFIYCMNSEIIELDEDMNYCCDVFVNGKSCSIVGSKKYGGTYEILEVNLENKAGVYNCPLTYVQLDEETFESTEDDSIYKAGHPLKESLEQAGQKIYSFNDFEKMLEEKEKNEGLTESVMEGNLVKWKWLER